MKTDLLASRHIGINEQDTAVMLRKIGVESLDELIDKTIPANIRLKEPLVKTNFIRPILDWVGIIRLLLPSFNGMYSRIRCGTPLILLIRRKYHRDVWKH